MPIRSRLPALALAALVAACERPTPLAAPDDPALPPGARALEQPASTSGDLAALERVARRLAGALTDPAFRAQVKEALHRSAIPEQKLHLQRFLDAPDRRAVRAISRATGEDEAAILDEARRTIPLELYFPVPEHRRAWTGGRDLLVAAAVHDGDAPVAYDLRGGRIILSPESPPATPVLLVGPAEFPVPAHGGIAPMTCYEACGGAGGGGGFSPPPGLYLTYAHFVRDFEGWFKGDPEYEIHILGQAGTTDSLTAYQCAGATAAGPYAFDQNEPDWSGRVLLFSEAQLRTYRSQHPGQNFRLVALEDDDGACAIRLDADRFKAFLKTLQAQYPGLTGSKDTATSLRKWVKRADALQQILRAAYSWITTQDDLIGNAIEDVVAGEYRAGANWIVKGEQGVTNGWLKLEVR